MSIRSLTHRVKNEVRCYGLWRKTSTAKTKETVSAYIMSYLDETSKAEALEESRKQAYATVQHGVSAPQEVGIDYLSKEEKGRIRVFGFLRDDVSRLGGVPSHLLDNDQRVIACHRAWLSRLDEHPGVKKFAHKYVLSLDPRFCELMGAAGRDADALLIQGVRTVMRRFQEKFYPGDRLGYMVGVRHDRKHLHAHILLFPFTENGQHLRVTDKGEDKRFHDLRKIADKFVRDYFFKEFDAPVKASERPADKVMQSRMLSMIAWQGIPKTIPEGDRYAWAANEKRRMQGLSEAELRPILNKRHEDLIKLFQDKTSSLGGRKEEEVQKLLQNIGRQQVTLKLQLLETEGQIKEVKERQLALGNEFQSAQKEMSTFRYYTARRGMYGRGVYEAETADQRRWLNNLLADPATAGVGRAALSGGAPYRILSDINSRGQLKSYLDGGRGAGHLSRDLLRVALRIRMDDIRKERDKVKAELEQAYARRQGLLAGLDAAKVGEALVSGIGRGRMPMVLEQYVGLKKIGAELPILCRNVPPAERVAAREAEQVLTTFEELNRRIMNTLKAFKADKGETDIFEIDRYFRSITDATMPAGQVQKAAEAEQFIRAELETKTVQEFLVGHNKQDAQAEEAIVSKTLKNIRKEPEFDL